MDADAPGSPPAPEIPPPGPRRTPRGDAAVIGFTAALLTGIAEVTGHALALPRLPWAIGAAAAAVLSSIAARAVRGPDSVTAWQAAAFCAAGAWLGWARFADVKTAAPWLWLAGVAVVLAGLYPLLKTRHLERIDAQRRRAEERARLAEENRWPRLLEKIGYPGVKATGRADTDSGYVLGLRLPGSGRVTIKKLRADVERLEVAADARHGSLHFAEGETARNVLLYVSTRDFLAGTIPYEDNGELLTIQNPIPIGRYEDGTICELTLREIAVLIVGLRGSGKSTLLNVVIAQLARCVDVLLFVIDTKYRLAMPWVRPYLEDEANGMVIDWAATNRSEVEIMLRAFVRGIHARAESGAGEEEKIEPEPARPAVFLIIDELASIFGFGTGPKSSLEGTTNTTLAGLGTDAIRLGRSEAMDLIAASQRGTVTMVGSGDFKSQFAVQIGLHVANEADARSVMPDDQEAARILATLRHPGTGLVKLRDKGLMRVKFFRITPEQVGEIARRYGPVKPSPEAVLRAALGTEYETRWDRFRQGSKAAASTGPRPGTPDGAGDAARSGTGDAVGDAVGDAAGDAAGDAVGDAARNGGRNGGDATEREFREITSHLGDIGTGNGVGGAARRRIWDFMKRSGDRGVTISMIMGLMDSEQLDVNEPAVRRWLAGNIDRGLVERTARGLYRICGR